MLSAVSNITINHDDASRHVKRMREIDACMYEFVDGLGSYFEFTADPTVVVVVVVVVVAVVVVVILVIFINKPECMYRTCTLYTCTRINTKRGGVIIIR